MRIRKNKIDNFIDMIGQEQMDSHSASNLIDFAIKLIPRNVKKILCVGFGSGYEIRKLTEMGFDVIGIDYNRKLDGFKTKRMDMHDMKFKDGTFDLVFARDVFEHSVAPVVAFSEMCRVSKKFVYITLPDDTWALSAVHTIIPTLKQMIAWGIKFDYALDWFNEMYHQANKMIIKESYYIFRKK